ncbi:MbtH family protein [Pontibacillus sp. ALD_SL1]|uniref:MbtH family protein n=1 Tax=Pontibacillus sp. ALD_SL1 TaxID=2777185 RepID=UPI001A97C966|nr:MbtH family protein [Pontibacillus sp. ALD_SL1]QST01044.1 MbtH family protein [Pontibacillus sp. ALD_SL1]
MKNPFQHNEGTFYALQNHKGQYSLWPSFLDIPEGWDIRYGEASREDCVSYIETHWSDIRVQSGNEALAGTSYE